MDETFNTCMLLNACNSINYLQLNKPIEKIDGMKFCQLNKLPNNRHYKKELLKGLIAW